MIHITIGCECGDRLDCDKSKKCKYGKVTHRLHNLSVNIHRFFQYRFHIKLPYLVYINRKYKRLSGTNKCPYKKSRNYTCYDCKFHHGIETCKISISDRKENIPEDGWSKHSKCGSFDKAEWADEYKDNN